jgi:hypothetical protein
LFISQLLQLLVTDQNGRFMVFVSSSKYHPKAIFEVPDTTPALHEDFGLHAVDSQNWHQPV